MTFFQVENLSKRFYGLTAVKDLDMQVSRGEIVGLIGPNGAGKSTTLGMIGGTLAPSHGRVLFKDEDITKLAAHRRCQKGITRVFQHDVFFESLTVLENVLMGLQLHSRMGLPTLLFGGKSATKQEAVLRDRARSLLTLTGLAEHAEDPAANLSHGNQRLLSLTIALATQPQLVLLDEPLSGMNAAEVAGILSLIRSFRDQYTLAAILVEHNVQAVLSICDRIYVLCFGEKIAEGLPAEITTCPRVVQAYLGVDHDAS